MSWPGACAYAAAPNNSRKGDCKVLDVAVGDREKGALWIQFLIIRENTGQKDGPSSGNGDNAQWMCGVSSCHNWVSYWRIDEESMTRWPRQGLARHWPLDLSEISRGRKRGGDPF
jgi:hypothetical protein